MNRKTKVIFAVLAAALAVMAVVSSGCGVRPEYRPTMMEQDDEWINMVRDYRKASLQNPEDQDMKTSLKKAELDAAEHFYRQSLELQAASKLDEAIAAMQKGLAVMPNNDKINSALAVLLARRESGNAYKEAMVMKESGNIEEAQKLLEKALDLEPGSAEVMKELDKINADRTSVNDPVFSSKKKVTIKFMNADLKTVMDFIAASYGINVIYDESARTLPVSVAAEDATLDQALKSVMNAAGAFYKRIGDLSLLVSQDTKAKRDQYEELYLRTYQLNSVKASDMANILKNTLNLKRVSVNEAINAVTIRDTQDILKLASKIVSLNDRKPAEVIFDVEIMEVNRTKAEQLGLNYGSQVSLMLPTPTNVGSMMAMKFVDLVNQGTITLPAFTLNFFKQDVDAKMLANPRVRVIEGKQAKIHIGDRVPLRSSTIQDATGQVRYTYDYKDIGVMLDVTPKINLDNSVNVTLSLEVSSLGSNIGTQTDPAYSIGTRDASTTMILRDGETAILGGLIRDEERHNRTKIPGLGDIPVLGSIFTTAMDESDTRTDVLLTITPRVVRSWDVIGKDLRDIYSGTESSMSSEPRYTAEAPKQKNKKTQETEPAPAPQVDISVNTVNAVSDAVTETAVSPGDVMLYFGEAQYIMQNGQDGTVLITADNLEGAASMSIKLGFNPEFVRFTQATGMYGAMVSSPNKAQDGVVDLNFTFDPDKKPGQKEALAEVKFAGIKQGVSYLVYVDSKAADKDGKAKNVSKTASRLVIK
jgi:general secretion pathway protein D